MPEQLPPPISAPMMKPHLPRMGPRWIELKEEGIEDKEQSLADTTIAYKIKPPFTSPNLKGIERSSKGTKSCVGPHSAAGELDKLAGATAKLQQAAACRHCLRDTREARKDLKSRDAPMCPRPTYRAPAVTCVVPHRQLLHFSKLIPSYSTATFGIGGGSKGRVEATQAAPDPTRRHIRTPTPGRPHPRPAAPAQTRPRKPSRTAVRGRCPVPSSRGGGCTGPTPTATAAVPRCPLTPQPRPTEPRACAPTLRNWAKGGEGGRHREPGRSPEHAATGAAQRGGGSRGSPTPTASPSLLPSPLPPPIPVPSPRRARPRQSGREDPPRPRGRLRRPMGARGALPALGTPANRRAAWEEAGTGLAPPVRHSPPAHSKKKKKKKKKKRRQRRGPKSPRGDGDAATP
ncbi:uncharacterized protein LOC116443275 [Corvus moneduloides]|uniref:uncharacterized protein LOC116443275 n=1 Tax=Corvus moneduloides TaxID=1196302 RepID=UPI00136299AA|nr:uncharacterized protein LOC116443275 [Corvus moneduloides]